MTVIESLKSEKMHLSPEKLKEDVIRIRNNHSNKKNYSGIEKGMIEYIRSSSNIRSNEILISKGVLGKRRIGRYHLEISSKEKSLISPIVLDYLSSFEIEIDENNSGNFSVSRIINDWGTNTNGVKPVTLKEYLADIELHNFDKSSFEKRGLSQVAKNSLFKYAEYILLRDVYGFEVQNLDNIHFFPYPILTEKRIEKIVYFIYNSNTLTEDERFYIDTLEHVADMKSREN